MRRGLTSSPILYASVKLLSAYQGTQFLGHSFRKSSKPPSEFSPSLTKYAMINITPHLNQEVELPRGLYSCEDRLFSLSIDEGSGK